MLLFLLYAVLVVGTVEASLPRLIISARVTRGYAPQDRVTRVKTIDALVDSIPYLGDAVTHAMKVTMLGYYDISMEMRKLYAISAKLLAMELKKLPSNKSVDKSVRVVVLSLPKEVTRILKDVIDAHKQLTSWNREMNAKVVGLFADLKRLVQDTATSNEALGKNPTEATVKRFADWFNKLVLRPLCELLKQNIKEAVAMTSRTHAMTYLLTSRNIAAVAHSYLNTLLLDRLHKQLFSRSVSVKAGLQNNSPLPRLIRLLALDKAAFVSQRFSRYNCYPDFTISPVPFPGDRETLARITQMNNYMTPLKATLDDAMADFTAAGDAAKSERSAASLARLTEPVLVMQAIKKKEEVSYRELQRSRQEHLAKGYAYFAAQSDS